MSEPAPEKSQDSPKPLPKGAKATAKLASKPSVKRSAKSSKTTSLPPHDPETPLEHLGWIRRPQLTALAKLSIVTVRDLLTHYPRRHEDRRRFDHFPDAESDRSFCLSGTVGKTVFRRFGRMRSFEAEIEEMPGSALSPRITLRWFNLFHVQKTVVSGSRLIVHGKVRLRGKRLMMEHPEFELVTEEDRQSIHLDRVVPVHPAGEGISVRVMRGVIHRALTETDWKGWTDPLPQRQSDWSQALRNIHFPSEPEELEPARRELALRELLGVQTLVTARRNEARRPRGKAKNPQGILLGNFLKNLPFLLTAAQLRSVEAIRSDMAKPHRMHRLLQGDVGSGKTVVAASAMLLAIESGHRAVLMAPTQILAEQHFRNFSAWLAPLGISVDLLTGARKGGKRSLLAEKGNASAIIGTHALLHDAEAMVEAGLVVIDEQHKFGVLQRTRLASSASAPDVLVMTATPIPRTLALTIYGDLDLSILDERPPGRGRLRTAARTIAKLPEIIAYLREELAKGRQAYVVYPLIEESEKLAAKAAEAEIDAWMERMAPFPCSLLHGRMGAGEKEAVMESFRTGRTKVLVTTSVIEVGVDVPNATFLLVENAERFGLAQLHQLRGRIGRGEHTSTCVLIEGSGNPEAMERLRILEASNDGFVIAEEDLRLRGSGNILGTEQSGLPPLRIADLYRDADLIAVASGEAGRILCEDPSLTRQEHSALRHLMALHAGRLKETGG
jgi:ATP-dependent DNA helicase RecG